MILHTLNHRFSLKSLIFTKPALAFYMHHARSHFILKNCWKRQLLALSGLVISQNSPAFLRTTGFLLHLVSRNAQWVTMAMAQKQQADLARHVSPIVTRALIQRRALLARTRSTSTPRTASLHAQVVSMPAAQARSPPSVAWRYGLQGGIRNGPLLDSK